MRFVSLRAPGHNDAPSLWLRRGAGACPAKPGRHRSPAGLVERTRTSLAPPQGGTAAHVQQATPMEHRAGCTTESCRVPDLAPPALPASPPPASRPANRLHREPPPPRTAAAANRLRREPPPPAHPPRSRPAPPRRTAGIRHRSPLRLMNTPETDNARRPRNSRPGRRDRSSRGVDSPDHVLEAVEIGGLDELGVGVPLVAAARRRPFRLLDSSQPAGTTTQSG